MHGWNSIWVDAFFILLALLTNEQTYIALFGVTAIALSQSKQVKYQKWACVFGLIGQPFWFYTSYRTQQWGIFALCFLYSAAWTRGAYNHWIKRSVA